MNPLRGPSLRILTFLSLYPLLPSPSYLSQSRAPTLGREAGVPRRHPSLDSGCISSPGVSILGQGWRGQQRENLLGLRESGLNSSSLEKAITLTRLWFLTKVLQSYLSGCVLFPPLLHLKLLLMFGAFFLGMRCCFGVVLLLLLLAATGEFPFLWLMAH